MMLIQALRFAADDSNQMLLILLQRHEPAQLLHGAGHGRQGLSNFVGDRGGKTAQRGHAFLCGNFFLETA